MPAALPLSYSPICMLLKWEAQPPKSELSTILKVPATHRLITTGTVLGLKALGTCRLAGSPRTVTTSVNAYARGLLPS